MNIIRIVRLPSTKFGVRLLQSSACAEYFAEKLPCRSIIRLKGPEVTTFLQGLITNDIHHLHRDSGAIYTMFLNKQGRVLYDSIVYHQPNQENTLLVESDKVVVDELVKHLKLFRVRRKIEIDNAEKDYAVWTVFSVNGSAIPHEQTTSTDFLISKDPRLKELGFRLILPSSSNIGDVNLKISVNSGIVEASDNYNYQLRRYHLGIAEGTQELPPTKCFPIESNADFLHGVSFQKGCYLGQEFTARTYHTGVIRKRIMPFQLNEELKAGINGTDITLPNGNAIGKVRGLKGIYGIGLLKVEQALEAPYLFVGDIQCTVSRPDWWPKKLPSVLPSKIG